MKSRTVTTRLALIMTLLIGLSLIPQSLNAQQNGGQPGAFLRLGVGVRAMGLGSAFTGLADDVSAAYWNPAGMGQLKYAELTGTYSLLSMQRQHNYVGFAVPVPRAGTFAFSWINLGVGDIEGRDLNGNFTNTFVNSENAYLLSWGLSVHRILKVGVSAKILSHSLDDFQATGFGFDAGVLLKPFDFLSFGAVFQDLGTRVKWNTDNATRESFPMVMRLGGAFRPFNLPVQLCADYEMVQNQIGTFHGGAELDIFRISGLRIGLSDGRFTAGGYVSVPLGSINLQTDYSFGQDPIDKTYMHRFSFSMRFAFGNINAFRAPSIGTRPTYGVVDLMSPSPVARVIKTDMEYTDYALINSGANQGLKEGMVLYIYRLERNPDTGKEEAVRIGSVKVVQVREELSAVRIESIRDNTKLRAGDVIDFDRDR